MPVVDNPNHFYSDPSCHDLFYNFLATITSRINTCTNVAYRQDICLAGNVSIPWLSLSTAAGTTQLSWPGAWQMSPAVRATFPAASCRSVAVLGGHQD